MIHTDVQAVLSCRCYVGAMSVLCRCRSSGRLIQAFDLLGVRVSSVRMNRGEGVAGAVPTDIAIGPPPSEKMPKVRTLRKNA